MSAKQSQAIHIRHQRPNSISRTAITPGPRPAEDRKIMKATRLFLHVLVVAVSVFSTMTARANEGEVWQIRGVGQHGCGKWIEARRENSTMVVLYEQWVASFIVSYNYYQTDRARKLEVDMPDFPTINAYLDKFCSDKPLFTVAFGAAQLVQELGGVKALHNRPRPK